MPRGGARQKAAWALAQGLISVSGSASSESGHLAALLLEKRAFGHMSANTIREIAAAAQADGCKCKQLALLAGIGANGVHPQNADRDLRCLLIPTPLTSILRILTVPLKLHLLQVKEVDCQILYPHELFAALYQFHPAVFIQRLCGGAVSNVTNFWSSMKGHPSFALNPSLRDPSYSKSCIPISLHGDGVPVAGCGRSWSKSVTIYSWGSLLGKGNTLQRVFMIFLLHSLLAVKNATRNTMQVFWIHLVWSFGVLQTGKWPHKDAKGRAYPSGSPEADRAGTFLAGGWTATLWLLLGDLEHFALSYDLEHYASNSPCFLCKANTTTMPWTDCRRNLASWLQNTWDNASWSARPGRHLLFTICGVSVSTVLPDVLHCKHLGTDTYYYGSVLMLLVHHIMTGNASANLGLKWQEIKEEYRAMHIRNTFCHMKASMFEPSHSTAFLRLKGKAAEIRNLGGPLLKVFEKHMTQNNKQHRLVRLGLQCSVELENILDEHAQEYCWEAVVSDAFVETAFRFLAVQTAFVFFFIMSEQCISSLLP